MPDAEMRHAGDRYCFCTYFDRNYLARGLALYESLQQHCRRPFVLWVLCFDDETYSKLSSLQLSDMRLISQKTFEANDVELVQTKASRSRVEYYWTCTPSLPLYLLMNYPEVELITYLDADLYFYRDPEPIFREMGDSSILIVEHRYASEHAHWARTSGIYNVGWLTFRRDVIALECLRWWRDKCIKWCYKREEQDRYGDQKYLDAWPDLFRAVGILRHEGAGLAPWNLSRYRIRYGRNDITVNGKPLIFYHFHDLDPVSNRVFVPAGHSYQLKPSEVIHLYLPYARALTVAAAKAANVSFDDTPLAPHRSSKRWLLALAFEERLLVVAPDFVSLLFWHLLGWCFAAGQTARKGFAAYVSGDLMGAKRYLLSAVKQNPFVLVNLGIASILLEAWVGSERMKVFRVWRRTGSQMLARKCKLLERRK